MQYFQFHTAFTHRIVTDIFLEKVMPQLAVRSNAGMLYFHLIVNGSDLVYLCLTDSTDGEFLVSCMT